MTRRQRTKRRAQRWARKRQIDWVVANVSDALDRRLHYFLGVDAFMLSRQARSEAFWSDLERKLIEMSALERAIEKSQQRYERTWYERTWIDHGEIVLGDHAVSKNGRVISTKHTVEPLLARADQPRHEENKC